MESDTKSVVFPAQPCQRSCSGQAVKCGRIVVGRHAQRWSSLSPVNDQPSQSYISTSSIEQCLQSSNLQLFQEFLKGDFTGVQCKYGELLGTTIFEEHTNQTHKMKVFVFDECDSAGAPSRYVVGAHVDNPDLGDPEGIFWPRGHFDRPHLKLILKDEKKGTETNVTYVHLSTRVAVSSCPVRIEFQFPGKEAKKDPKLKQQQREPLRKLHELIRTAPTTLSVSPGGTLKEKRKAMPGVKRSASNTSSLSNSTDISADSQPQAKRQRVDSQLPAPSEDALQQPQTGYCAGYAFVQPSVQGQVGTQLVAQGVPQAYVPAQWQYAQYLGFASAVHPTYFQQGSHPPQMFHGGLCQDPIEQLQQLHPFMVPQLAAPLGWSQLGQIALPSACQANVSWAGSDVVPADSNQSSIPAQGQPPVLSVPNKSTMARSECQSSNRGASELEQASQAGVNTYHDEHDLNLDFDPLMDGLLGDFDDPLGPMPGFDELFD